MHGNQIFIKQKQFESETGYACIKASPFHSFGIGYPVAWQAHKCPWPSSPTCSQVPAMTTTHQQNCCTSATHQAPHCPVPGSSRAPSVVFTSFLFSFSRSVCLELPLSLASLNSLFLCFLFISLLTHDPLTTLPCLFRFL